MHGPRLEPRTPRRKPRRAFVFVRPSAEAERAFTAVLGSIEAELQRFILMFVRGDVHRARDLVQDTLLSAWSHLPDLRDPHLLRAWLHRVAYRNTMSSLRRKGPRGLPVLHLDLLPSQEVENPEVEGRPIWRVAGTWSESDEIAPALRARLAELPAHYALPLRLHYFESHGLAETASMLGLQLSTLKMRLHRGRALLRRRLVASETRRRLGVRPGAKIVGKAPIAPLPPPPPPCHPKGRAAPTSPATETTLEDGGASALDARGGA